MAPNIFVVPQVSLHFDYEKTDQIEGFVAYDVTNHRSVFIDEGVEALQGNLADLEWRTFERDTPGDKVQAFVEASLLGSPTR